MRLVLFPLPPPQVNKEVQAVTVRDLYGLWIILAGGIVFGLLIMIGQRTRRRYAKHHHTSTSGGGCKMVCEGGPLPQERRPAQLFSAMAASFRIRSKRRQTTAATGNRKGAAQERQADMASASSAEEGSQHHVTAAALPHPADIESASAAPSAVVVDGSPAAQQQQQQQSPEGQASAGRSREMERTSSLLAPESVYAAHQWKSLLRTHSSPGNNSS
jgi:hypothetical protein